MVQEGPGVRRDDPKPLRGHHHGGIAGAAGQPGGRAGLLPCPDPRSRPVHAKYLSRHAKGLYRDEMALALSLRCVDRDPSHENAAWRQFMLMPMMHSEDLGIQDRSIPLFEQHTNPLTHEYAVKHRYRRAVRPLSASPRYWTPSWKRNGSERADRPSAAGACRGRQRIIRSYFGDPVHEASRRAPTGADIDGSVSAPISISVGVPTLAARKSVRCRRR